MPASRFAMALVLSAQALSAGAAVAPEPERPTPTPTIVMGLGTSAREEALAAVESTFGAPALDRIVAADALGGGLGAPDAAGPVLALGADACAALAAHPPPRDVLCTLLYAGAFEAALCETGCERFRAIVMDPPPARQVAVTRALYPSLRRFGAFAADARSARGAGGPGDGAGGGSDDGPDGSAPGDGRVVGLRWVEFDRVEPMDEQIAALLRGSDALLVTPDASIHNALSLRSTLLTAYGYGRPVIGFGPAYVRAGALLTTYSTARQVLRQAADPSGRPASDANAVPDRTGVPPGPRVRYADEFSVIDNPSVARSLGLSRAVDVDPDRTFSDEDFRS